MANTSQTMAVDKTILPFRASSHALAVTSLWGRSVESEYRDVHTVLYTDA